MRSFIRGQRAKISDLSDRTRRFEVILTFCCGTIPVFDFVCFGTDAKNQLSDDRYMVFYNQIRAPDDSISLDQLQPQEARFTVDLDALPPHIERLTFTVSPEGSGQMNQVAVSFVTLREVGVEGADAVATYRFSGNDFGEETSLLLAEIYKKSGEWRFGAVGQGFAGGLSALLTFFGGQESEAAESAAQPPSAPNLAPPAPPISAPVLVSVEAPSPASHSRDVARGAARSALQKAIDDAPVGSTVQLVRGEFQGPILIDKPLVLEGNGAVIWTQNGPVVSVVAASVTLSNVEIEATAPDSSAPEAGPHFDVALFIAPGIETTLEKVRVRGEIVGVAAAQGQWKLPPLLNLGEFAAREANSFEFEIEVPHACEIKTNVSGISLSPPRVDGGRSRVELRAIGIGNDTFLAGHVELLSGGVGRTVPLQGRAASGAAAACQISLWRVDTPQSPA